MLFNVAIKCRYYVAILLCVGCAGICGSITAGRSVLLIGSEPAAVQAAVNGWCNWPLFSSGPLLSRWRISTRQTTWIHTGTT